MNNITQTRKRILMKSYRNKGVILSMSEDYEGSIEFLNKALEIEPDDYNALYHKAFVFKEMMQYDDSLVYYNKTIEVIENLEADNKMRKEIEEGRIDLQEFNYLLDEEEEKLNNKK